MSLRTCFLDHGFVIYLHLISYLQSKSKRLYLVVEAQIIMLAILFLLNIKWNIEHLQILFQLSTRRIYNKNSTIFATVVCISVNCVWDMTTTTQIAAQNWALGFCYRVINSKASCVPYSCRHIGPCERWHYVNNLSLYALGPPYNINRPTHVTHIKLIWLCSDV